MILGTQMDVGNLHVVYERISQKPEELRAEYVARQRTASVNFSCLAQLHVPQVEAVDAMVN